MRKRKPARRPSERSHPSVSELFGNKRISQKDLQKLHESIDDQWRSQAEADHASRAARAARGDRVYAPIHELLLGDRRSAALLKHEVARAQRRGTRALTPPKVEARQAGMSLGSFVVTFTPPYDFWWANLALVGTGLGELNADNNAGTMKLTVDGKMTTDLNGSSASGFAAVGVYYAPLTDCPAQLTVDVTIAFDSYWISHNIATATHSDGWLELEIRRFNMDVTGETVIASRRDNIWNADAYWLGYDETRTEVAYPMSLSATVDSQHFYNIWVKCSGRSSAAWTKPGFVGSTSAQIAASAPAIRCTLG
jgi:hypothetical protein